MLENKNKIINILLANLGITQSEFTIMRLHGEVQVLVVPTNIWEHGMPFDLYDLVLREFTPILLFCLKLYYLSLVFEI